MGMGTASASNADGSPSPLLHAPPETLGQTTNPTASEAGRDYIDDIRAERRRTARERLHVFVQLGELARERGYMPALPPLEIFNHPDLLEKAWGWDRILPFAYTVAGQGYSASLYKEYLHQYYSRNGGHNITSHVASDIYLCIEMEDQLMYLLEQCRDWKLHIDEFSLSKEITNHVHQINDMDCCEFPTAAIALKCITKEAHLLCELIESEFSDASNMGACSFIRKRALKFMTYKGTEHVAASATMMATMKEADLMLEFLEKRLAHDKKGVLFQCSILRNYTARVMSKICPDTTGNAGKLVPDEPDGKKYCEETNPQEGNVVNQKAQDCSKDLGKESYLQEREEAKQNTTVDTSVEFSKGELFKRRQPEGKERQEHDQGATTGRRQSEGRETC